MTEQAIIECSAINAKIAGALAFGADEWEPLPRSASKAERFTVRGVAWLVWRDRAGRVRVREVPR